MSELRVTPETLMEYANQVMGKAEELSTELESLKRNIDTVKESWDGLAATAFYNTYATLSEQLAQFPEIVKGLAQVAQTAAETYDTVDRTIAQGFNG
ncbi:MAG: WXG100 family type VII secretion target [Clostridia bacterium]|nr:WXG100 family type VII secretion target [Clostridia bacterium]